jgi:hypothetical protein
MTHSCNDPSCKQEHHVPVIDIRRPIAEVRQQAKDILGEETYQALFEYGWTAHRAGLKLWQCPVNVPAMRIAWASGWNARDATPLMDKPAADARHEEITRQAMLTTPITEAKND